MLAHGFANPHVISEEKHPCTKEKHPINEDKHRCISGKHVKLSLLPAGLKKYPAAKTNSCPTYLMIGT